MGRNSFSRNKRTRFFSLPVGFFLLLVFPASTNYQMKDYGFGGGGVSNATSSNYALEGILGEENSSTLTGATYNLGPGLQFTNQANVPPAPTFTNPSNYYNKLKIILDTGGNPSDTQFAIAISSDNFVTTNYVQNDNTVGTVLGSEDYQTYTNWGGASGVLIIGLASNTTYKVKVKAIQGKFTETGYGPTASVSTVNPMMTFDLDVAPTDVDNSVSTTGFGNLFAGTVTDSTDKIWVDFQTNAENGGKIYVYGSNAGLLSSRAAYTISAISGNLTALSEGYGAQGSTATGGLSISTAYSLASNNVNVADTTIREIFTASTPTPSGRASFLLKAKSSAITPAASDYTETLTIVGAARF